MGSNPEIVQADAGNDGAAIVTSSGSDIMPYHSIQPTLMKAIESILTERRVNKDKLAYRKKILKELEDHRDNGTFPKYITAMRTPQVPEDQQAEFSNKMDELNNQMMKSVLSAVIQSRKKDLTQLEDKGSEFDGKIVSTILNIREDLCQKGILSMDCAESYTNRFLNECKNADKITENKCKLEEISKKIQKSQHQDVPEEILIDNQPSEMDLMKQQIKDLRSEIEKVKRSAKPTQTPKAKAKKPEKNKLDKQPKKDKPKADKANNQPQPGKGKGAGGRAGKQNQPDKGKGTAGPSNKQRKK